MKMAIKQEKGKQQVVGQDMERLEPSYIAGGDVKQCSRFGNILVVPQHIKHRIILSPRNSTPRDFPQRTENGCSNKNL